MISVDNTKHSPFGVSKLSGDLLVQEYGKYFNLKTVCLRAGCLTGETCGCGIAWFIISI